MLRFLVFLGLVVFSVPTLSFAMAEGGCGGGSCTDCHSLSQSEAEQILGNGIDKVLNISLAEMPGLWTVDVQKGEARFPVYIDFSKAYLVAGSIILISDKQNVTMTRQAKLNKIDTSRIPLEDALLLGSPEAKTKVIVFTDPQCPYCKKFHEEMKIVVERDPSIAFLIKLYPLKMHPNAYDISKSIVCENSLELLEESFADRPVPPPACETTVVDETLALVKELNIQSTPTMVLPDGMVLPGFKKADQVLAQLGSKKVATSTSSAK